MKKGLLSLIIIAFCLIFVTACGEQPSLGAISRVFNDSKYVQAFKDSDTVFEAHARGNTLSIVVFTAQEDGSYSSQTLDYSYYNRILSGDFKDETEMYYAKFISVYLVDAINQLYDYKAGDIFYSLNDSRSLDYTLEKDGLSITSTEEQFKIDIDASRKTTQLDFSNIYLTVDDLKPIIKNNTASASKGLISFYSKTQGDESVLYVFEKNGITSNTYKTIKSSFEALFGSKKASKFLSKNYTGMDIGSKSFSGVKIETDYKLTENDFTTLPEEDFITTKITINIKTVKNAIKKMK